MTPPMHYLDYLTASHHFGVPLGLTSVCSAHPLVIEAALRHGLAHGKPVLIEATCNQVNQFGGYTGQTPAEFSRSVLETVERVGFPCERLILGGDHLGPLPWADEPAESAMSKAADLVRAFVKAGYTKIHLDCSMPLGGESHLTLEKIAQRTAALALAAEEEAPNGSLRYVLGSEVPSAGGAKSGDTYLTVTTPESAAETLQVMYRVFQERGLNSAWERVRALVVQPGVEFEDETIHEYDHAAAASLSQFIERMEGMVYEAHSTDYQTPAALRAMVEDHFAILKVGPALTFALREAVFALAEVEEALEMASPSQIRQALEESMFANPLHWQKHYGGSPQHQKFARAFSFSDRIRYYWKVPAVQAAFERLIYNLEQTPPPLSLLSQYLPYEYEHVRQKKLPLNPLNLLLARILRKLDEYAYAGNPCAS
jgi:D-tagatose-1,6-bisphosphate aldolase subunit GatZ/KbaZ